MSAETKAALDAAIASHIADEYDGDMVTAWVVLTETTSIDLLDQDEGSMVVEQRSMQSTYLTTGLLHSALSVTQGERQD